MALSKVSSQTEVPDASGSDIPEVIEWQQFDDSSISRDLVHRNDVEISTEEESVAELFDELKPVLYVMKVLGLFPLQRGKSEDSNFRRCKLTLIYSILFYMGMNVYGFYKFRENLRTIVSAEIQFDELIFTVVQLLYTLPHLYMIPCHWIEVSKVGKYFTHWYEFQEQFHRVTGKPLYLGLRKRAVLSIVLVPLIGIQYILCEVFLVKSAQFHWDMGFYMYIIMMNLLHVAWWWLVCSALRKAMKTYRCNLFKDHSIFDNESSAPTVAHYRSLWISLSKLSRETGLFMCYSYGHLSVLAFTVMTLQLYGSLSNIQDGQYLKHAGLALCVFLSAGMIYIMANAAHNATEEIGTEFSEKLSCLCASDKQVRRELKIFTQVMTANSCVINLGGYVTLNRGFLLNYVSMMVTYLIVLLQFRLGIMSLNPSSNTTATNQYCTSCLLK